MRLPHCLPTHRILILKQPGNNAVAYRLHLDNGKYEARGTRLPMQITQTVTNDGNDKIVSVKMKADADVQTQLTHGEIILPGNTTIGYLGFDNETGKAKLTFGYPYLETPRRYIRKLTLAP